jgi:hypothetical protein
MRTRAVLLTALISLPCVLDAQGGVRLPRGGSSGRGAPPTAAPLPPTAPEIAHALAYKRSRWSAEGYTLVSAVQVPTSTGSSNYTSFGTGTRADYRYTDRLSATLDLTYSPIGGSSTTETAEVGTRFKPLAADQVVRPFVDVRALYLHMHDTYSIPGSSVPIGGPNQQLNELGRYSRGMGGIVGTGFEYSLTNSFALTTEVAALRNRMSTYRLSGAPTVPATGAAYWMTTYRLTLGLRYNAVTALHLTQNPGQ